MRLMVKSCFQSWVGLVCVHLWSETSPRPPPFPTLKSSREQPDLGGRCGCLGLGSGRVFNSIMRSRSVIKRMKGKGWIWGEDTNHPINRKDLITGPADDRDTQISQQESKHTLHKHVNGNASIFKWDFTCYLIVKYVRMRVGLFRI